MNKRRFRESRTAIVLDLILIPVLLPWAILAHGLPEALRELRRLPRDVFDNWKGRHWV